MRSPAGLSQFWDVAELCTTTLDSLSSQLPQQQWHLSALGPLGNCAARQQRRASSYIISLDMRVLAPAGVTSAHLHEGLVPLARRDRVEITREAERESTHLIVSILHHLRDIWERLGHIREPGVGKLGVHSA